MTTSLQDLLERAPIAIADRDLRETLAGRRVVVTGAAGSIGSALARRLLRLDVARLVLLDSSEQGLHELALELRDHGAFERTRLVLGDAGDTAVAREIFRDDRPHFVFHAAAHKHAPLLEGQPLAAVRNNLLVTSGLMDFAADHGCERFVVVSTDKAVRPRSILGATKNLAERLVLSSGAEALPATAVRLGNVWGSRGSVVPYFLARIAAGEPLVVTDPAATRYFMSEDEAVSVTLAAVKLGRGADVLVPELGPPVAILDVANRLLADHGPPGVEAASMRYSGLRPGDKLTELLLEPDELLEPSGHERIVRVVGPVPDRERLLHAVRRLESACRAGDRRRLLEALREALPEYLPSADALAGARTDGDDARVGG